MSGGEVILRFDTEDFLTPESDDALGAILALLAAEGIRATFPLVGAKLRALRERRRSDLLAALAGHDVGYHSDTHSEHPTIAEELAGLGWEDGARAFAEREGAGAERVGEAFGGLACYTQPGGNWAPQALPVLRAWGVPCHFSELWNSYLDTGGAPVHYGGLLHWSPAVAAPKPLLSRLPAALPEALALVEEALGGPWPACVVTHPTELCTTEFWDAVNFGRGRSPGPEERRRAPLRPAEEVEAATAALRAWLAALRRAGCSFLSVSDLVHRFPDRARGRPVPVRSLSEAIRGAAAPVAGWGATLSAAEVFAAVIEVLAAEGGGVPEAVPYRYLDGPGGEPAGPRATGRLAPDDLRAVARWCRQYVRAAGRVPDGVPLRDGSAAPADVLAAAAAALRGEEVLLRPAELPAARCVRPPEQLHWDWPVFPEGFTAPGLRALAVLQCWTLKPAVERGSDVADGPWRACRPDIPTGSG